MSKRKGRKTFTARQQPTDNQQVHSSQPFEAFSFGEPTAVLDKRDIMDYAECVGNGRWYEPPVSFHGTAKVCGQLFTTARRFTLSAIFWHLPSSLTPC